MHRYVYNNIDQYNNRDQQSVQYDLHKLVKWSEKLWQMLLNFGKCKCIHIGYRPAKSSAFGRRSSAFSGF